MPPIDPEHFGETWRAAVSVADVDEPPVLELSCARHPAQRLVQVGAVAPGAAVLGCPEAGCIVQILVALRQPDVEETA